MYDFNGGPCEQFGVKFDTYHIKELRGDFMNGTVENISSFLGAFELYELASMGIINGGKRILTGASVAPLIRLMDQKGVARLEFGDNWSLDAGAGSFRNRYAGYDGPAALADAVTPGEVFRGANRHINPFYTQDPYENGKNGRAERPRANSRGRRATDLAGAGAMNDMLNSLPLNRKERYWTSCVFPNIVCGDGFGRLHAFLRLAGVPDDFIKSEYSNSDICFYTEYSLKESALDWPEMCGLRRDTPDIVILLRANDGRKFLVAVEAKMYDYVTPADLARQMARQLPVINAVLRRNAMPADGYVHIGLVLDRTPEFEKALLAEFAKVSNPSAPVANASANAFENANANQNASQAGAGPAGIRPISWRDIINAYQGREGDYFYEMLKVACANPQLKTTMEAYLMRKPANGRK